MISRNLFLLAAFLLLCGFSASAQTPASEFKKDGLSFSYPAGWTFNDNSNADAQQMTFGRADSDAQITVFVFRVVGQRLVVLTFLGPDKALIKATPVWDAIRTTMKIEAPLPQAKPSSKANPSKANP